MSPPTMTPDEHRARHKELHARLDELLADYLRQHPGSRPSSITLMEFIEWSYQQTIAPTVAAGDRDR